MDNMMGLGMSDEQREKAGRDELTASPVERPGYLALVEGDIIKPGDEWLTVEDKPQWVKVEKGDADVGKKYLTGAYMLMRRAR